MWIPTLLPGYILLMTLWTVISCPAACELFAKSQVLVQSRYPDFMDSDEPETKWRLRSNAQRTFGYALFSAVFTFASLRQPLSYIVSPAVLVVVGLSCWLGLPWYFNQIDNQSEAPQKPWNY